MSDDESIQKLQEVIRAVQDIVNKTQRNDECPCGSGLKFKKCCLVMNSTRKYHPGGLNNLIERAKL